MDHTLSLLKTSPYPIGGFVCNLCREEGCGPVYHCSDCDFDVHVACAAMTTQQTHFSHSYHPLYLTHCGGRCCKCNSCGLGIHTWSFRCEHCNYNMHSMCVRAPRFMMHFCHPHPLALSKAADFPGASRCDGCKLRVSNLFYRCHSCRYNLHQACATLPSKIKHVKHQAHMLTMISRADQFSLCHECREQVNGWCFHCAMCNFNLHPGCADLAHELPHFDVGVNCTHERSNAATSTSASGGCPIPHDNTALILHSISRTLSANSSAHARSNPTTSASGSIGRGTILNDQMAPISRSATHNLLPTDKDWEAVDRVLRFAQEMAKGAAAAQGNSSSYEDDNQDHCPTCLEAFDSTNPRQRTSCGHYFHLACILQWMETSTNCPICRKPLKIST